MTQQLVHIISEAFIAGAKFGLSRTREIMLDDRVFTPDELEEAARGAIIEVVERLQQKNM